MPSKQDSIRAHFRNDPLVPIVGRRVAAALAWRGKSETQAAIAADVSRQAMAKITKGRTRKCHRSVRAAIAKVCGSPVTAKYLGGEADLRLPPLSVLPSGRANRALMPIDLAGFPKDALGQLVESAPQYELEGFTLGQTIKSATRPDNDLGGEYPPPDIEHTARWMVSLYLWREFLFGNQVGALGGDSYPADASAFAYHTAQAMAVLLRPWSESRVKLRPRMLQRWANHLDGMVAEMVGVRLAQDNGDLSELAIWEIAGGNHQLTEHLRATRNTLRDEGVTDETITAMIRGGDGSI